MTRSRFLALAGATCSLWCVIWTVVHCSMYGGAPGVFDWYDRDDDGPWLPWALNSGSVQSVWIIVSGTLAILFLLLARPLNRWQRTLLAATISALLAASACPRF